MRRLTASGEHTGILLNISQNDSMGFKLIGTRGQSLENRHEGRGGWTVADYAGAGREALYFTVHGVKVAPGGNPAVRDWVRLSTSVQNSRTGSLSVNLT